MITIVGIMAAGKHGAGAVAESSHPDSQAENKKHTGHGTESLETSSLSPVTTFLQQGQLT